MTLSRLIFQVFRNLLNSNVFGTERLKVFTTDEKRAIAIRAGDDKEEKIGMAPGSEDYSGTSWGRKLSQDLVALEADLSRLGIPIRTVSREELRARDEKMDVVRSIFSKTRGSRRELKDALNEAGCNKLGELVHTGVFGTTPTVEILEQDGLMEWYGSMLNMEATEGEVGIAFDHDEFKEESVDSTRAMRDHELEKYRKAAEAKVRKELALKGERKDAKDGKKKVRKPLAAAQ